MNQTSPRFLVPILHKRSFAAADLTLQQRAVLDSERCVEPVRYNMEVRRWMFVRMDNDSQTADGVDQRTGFEQSAICPDAIAARKQQVENSGEVLQSLSLGEHVLDDGIERQTGHIFAIQSEHLQPRAGIALVDRGGGGERSHKPVTNAREQSKKLVSREGIEPSTRRLRGAKHSRTA